MLRHTVALLSILAFCTCLFLHTTTAVDVHAHHASPLSSVAFAQDHARNMTGITDLGTSFIALLLLALSLLGAFFAPHRSAAPISFISRRWQEAIPDQDLHRWRRLHTTSPPRTLAFS